MASLLTACIVAPMTLLLQDQFKSEAQILPADVRSGAGTAAIAAASVGISLPGQDSPDAAYVDILNSRPLRESLLKKRYKFHVRTWRFGALMARESSLYDYLGKKNMDLAIRALKERITILRDVKTKLLTLAVETESPELSQGVVRSLASLLEDFVVSKSQTRGSTKASFAGKRLGEARVEMVQAEAAFLAFLNSNRNYVTSPDPAVRVQGMRLENELKLRTQIVATLAITREQALLEEKNDMPILNVLDGGNLPIEKNGPVRSQIVLMSAIIVFLIVMGYQNRRWLLSRLGG